MTQIRSPIVSVLGHVDHGKSSLLDAIRGSNIVATEAGAITQAIGASIIPLDVIKKKCGKLLEKLDMTFTIPGLLFIDTPGHAAFTSLRKRGGNLADIAIVVIDINEGFKPQTIEAIEILRAAKTPFIIAANKIDLLPGYKKFDDSFLVDVGKQAPQVQELLDTRIYQLLATLHEKFHIACERFDRADFTQQVAVVPVSAKQDIGIPELLMVLTGLAQKFLEKSLKLEVSGPAKGTILEIKEEKGLGTTLDVIIYDGTLKVNDIIVIGGTEKPIVTKVRALFLPDPLAEMRDKKTKYKPVKEIAASCGVKVSAPDIKDAIAGMPIRATSAESLEQTKQEIQEEINEVLIATDKEGLIIKGDTLGSLEALTLLLREKGITIRKASVGPISKKDISDAESAKDPFQAVILGFNIPVQPSTDKITIIVGNIIYQIIDDLLAWKVQQKKTLEEKELDSLVRPCKLEVLKNCCFRQNNPCVLGIEIMAGVLRPMTPLMSKGRSIGLVKSMECENESIGRGDKGKQCAISLPDVTFGRQVAEGDILYADVPEEDFRRMKKLASLLKEEEKQVLRELAEIRRKENVVWGI
jgi:translation initiation factor 5B